MVTDAVNDGWRVYAFPYGLTLIAPALCTVIGLILFHIAAFGCNTFKTVGTYNGYFSNYLYTVGYGYWSCTNAGGYTKLRYSGSAYSGAIRFGRFIGVFGALLIWAVFAFVVGASFVRYPRSGLVFRSIAICMVVLSVFSFLLLVGLSEAGSQLSGGGASAILAAFIWFGGAVAVLFLKERVARGGGGGGGAATATAAPGTAGFATAAAPPPKQAAGEETTTNDDDDEQPYPAATTTAEHDIHVPQQQQQPAANKPTTRVEVVQHPDGSTTKTTTTTTELPDGSKSIEETIETTEA